MTAIFTHLTQFVESRQAREAFHVRMSKYMLPLRLEHQLTPIQRCCRALERLNETKQNYMVSESVLRDPPHIHNV